MSISTEEKDRYLRETAIVLAREGFQTGKTDTGKLRVLLDGAPLCEVTENGGITYRNEDIIIIIPGKIPAPAKPHKMPSNFVSINSATIKQTTPKSTYSIPVIKLLFFIFCTSFIDKDFFNPFAKKV